MIFPKLSLENILQVDDKTRLDGTKSFITVDEAAITLVEIEPEAAAGFIDVTSNSYLDWSYATDGTKTVSLRITTDAAPITVTKDIEVITEVDDRLFSSDEDLLPHEDDILRFVRPGRSSFLDKHRAAQELIVDWLDHNRIFADDGSKLTKTAIFNVEEVRQWSKFLTLAIIFESLSNATDDIFFDKAMRYKELAKKASNRGALRLDKDGDGEKDSHKDLRTFRLVKR